VIRIHARHEPNAFDEAAVIAMPTTAMTESANSLVRKNGFVSIGYEDRWRALAVCPVVLRRRIGVSRRLSRLHRLGGLTALVLTPCRHFEPPGGWERKRSVPNRALEKRESQSVRSYGRHAGWTSLDRPLVIARSSPEAASAT
jgi:hypothetical protein